MWQTARWCTWSNASRDAFTPDGVVNPDGTITFTDTLTGMPMRVYTSHSNTLVKDVGYLSIVATFDSQGNFLERAGDRARAAPVRGRLHGVLRRDRVRDRVVRRILVRGGPLRSPLPLQAHTTLPRQSSCLEKRMARRSAGIASTGAVWLSSLGRGRPRQRHHPCSGDAKPGRPGLRSFALGHLTHHVVLLKECVVEVVAEAVWSNASRAQDWTP